MSKKIIFFITVFITIACFGQNFKNPFKINDPIEIYLADGTVLNGLGHIGYENKVVFKENKKAKKQVFDERTVSKIVFEKLGMDLILEYKIVKGSKAPLLLEPVVKGSITLYRDIIEVNRAMNNGDINGSSNFLQGYNSYKITDYYISKNNEIFVEKITSTHPFSKNFKKAASIYFKNCPELVEKIESKEFKKDDIRRVVRYYNTRCYKRPITTENDSLNNKKYSDKLNLRNGKSI